MWTADGHIRPHVNHKSSLADGCGYFCNFFEYHFWGDQEDAQEKNDDFEEDEEFELEAWAQEEEITMPNYVARRVMISQAMNDQAKRKIFLLQVYHQGECLDHW